MANAPVNCPDLCTSSASHNAKQIIQRRHTTSLQRYFAFLPLAAALFLAPLLFAQEAASRVVSVDPTSGKVDDTITLMGENLGKASVSAVFLSDDKKDYPATMTMQADDKIVMKVPKVMAGNYNVSVQVKDNIYIEPVHFMVEQ